MDIIDLLPSYSHINVICSKIGRASFDLNDMKEVNTFYACYSDMVQLERAILKSVDSMRLDVMLKRLREEASCNLMYHAKKKGYIEFMENIGLNDIPDIRAIRLEIKKQTNKVNEIYGELKDLDHKLDWPVNYSNYELTLLERKRDKTDAEHKAMSKVLADLYDEERQIKKTIATFLNTLSLLESMDKSVITLVDKYCPASEETRTTKNSGNEDDSVEKADVSKNGADNDGSFSMPDNKKANNPKGRCVEPFERLLNGSDMRKEATRKLLREMISGKKSKGIALVLTCAIDSTLMTKPTYKQLVAEYVPEEANPTSVIGSENSIIQQIGKCHYASVDYDAMMKVFEKLRMMP